MMTMTTMVTFLRAVSLLVPLIALMENNHALKCVTAYTNDAFKGTGKNPNQGGAAASATEKSSPSPFSPLPSLRNFDYRASDRLPWIEDGYGVWNWKTTSRNSISDNDGIEEEEVVTHDVNYLELGDPSKPALLLIHGFGASAYHFRYNIPDLARDFHVYAFDKLGFGLSAKPVQEYSPEVWRDQAIDFIDQVIGKPTTVAGNSIGGLTALYASADSSSSSSRINGCVLLNAAGRFKETDGDSDSAPTEEKKTTAANPLVKKVLAFVQRAVIAVSFVVTKQPARIEQVLRQVYPVNGDAVDAELVESIRVPSTDKNAPEVFYRVITKNSGGGDDGKPPLYIDDLLEKLECPLLLCWGEEDPWIRPAAADRIQALYPASRTKRVSINAGHCPHDEAPAAVNAAIREFVNGVNS